MVVPDGIPMLLCTSTSTSRICPTTGTQPFKSCVSMPCATLQSEVLDFYEKRAEVWSTPSSNTCKIDDVHRLCFDKSQQSQCDTLSPAARNAFEDISSLDAAACCVFDEKSAAIISIGGNCVRGDNIGAYDAAVFPLPASHPTISRGPAFPVFTGCELF